ncbi:MAG: [Fe-S]-binding protein [Bacteroidota bacterium]|nr:[Fe-S]-binding protein [Bacteroidota bacterium]
MNTTTENKIPVTLTLNALSEVKNLLNKGHYSADFGLRLGVKGGGCAGFSYILDFDVAKDNDHIFEMDGIRVIIDKSQEIYLLNCEVDFKSGLDNRGFIFNNPNATDTCGCGTSFSA